MKKLIMIMVAITLMFTACSKKTETPVPIKPTSQTVNVTPGPRLITAMWYSSQCKYLSYYINGNLMQSNINGTIAFYANVGDSVMVSNSGIKYLGDASLEVFYNKDTMYNYAQDCSLGAWVRFTVK